MAIRQFSGLIRILAKIHLKETDFSRIVGSWNLSGLRILAIF